MKVSQNRCVRAGLAALALSLLSPLAAGETGGYDSRPEGQAFINEMTARYGFESEPVTRLLASAQRQEKILEAISRPAEKTLEWHEYRRIFIKPERIARGVEFLREHQEAFARAEAEFGVPATVVAAIIGVETWYGTYTGKYRVLDSLATLAFDYPPRSKFFRSELAQFMLMVREQGLDPETLTGSYAGAMGYGQFISSSYRNFAVDFDGDGRIDLLNSPVDAIGSVANYFSKHRWQPGEPVADRLAQTLPDDSPLLTRELRPVMTVSEYRNAGLQPLASVSDSDPARALQVLGDQGPELWLTYYNFYVITRYNHSHLYAMAVHELARTLQQAMTEPQES